MMMYRTRAILPNACLAGARQDPLYQRPGAAAPQPCHKPGHGPSTWLSCRWNSSREPDGPCAGPATSGQLTSQFTPPAKPSGITLQRDFFTLVVVPLKSYLLGSPPAADPATQAQQPPPVRINVINQTDPRYSIPVAAVSSCSRTFLIASNRTFGFSGSNSPLVKPYLTVESTEVLNSAY